jgi:hypothetical protein
VDSKKWYLSKTLWVNIIQIILDMLTLTGWLVPIAGPIIGIVASVLNIILRILKVVPLSF